MADKDSPDTIHTDSVHFGIEEEDDDPSDSESLTLDEFDNDYLDDQDFSGAVHSDCK